MGRIFLVRHGQASWGADDYDVLSPLGERQASLVGPVLAELLGGVPEVVVHGSMRRQRDTARLAAQAAGWPIPEQAPTRHGASPHSAGIKPPLVAEEAPIRPEWREDPGWDEMDYRAVLAGLPRTFGDGPNDEPGGGKPDRRQFQQWFEEATVRWTGGGADEDYAEPYPRFVERVSAALDALASVDSAVVFTSGGPISVAGSRLLDGGAAAYRRLSPVVVNTGITRIVSGSRGLTLVGFNDHQHLAGETLSYR